MLISCRRASELSSKARDEKLSIWETVRMWGHLFMCAVCHQFKRQIDFISTLFKSEELLNTGPCMKPEAKDKILKMLSNDLKQ